MLRLCVNDVLKTLMIDISYFPSRVPAVKIAYSRAPKSHEFLSDLTLIKYFTCQTKLEKYLLGFIIDTCHFCEAVNHTDSLVHWVVIKFNCLYWFSLRYLYQDVKDFLIVVRTVVPQLTFFSIYLKLINRFCFWRKLDCW